MVSRTDEMCLAAKFPTLMCSAFYVEFKLKYAPDNPFQDETIYFIRGGKGKWNDLSNRSKAELL